MSQDEVEGRHAGMIMADGRGAQGARLTFFFAAVAALGAAFHADILSAITVWWVYPAYSHCFLILPISAWLVWEKRAQLALMAPTWAPQALWLAVPILATFAVGQFASITELRQFSLIGLINIFCVVIFGWPIYRKIAFAGLYLFFLVPTGQYLIPYLQETTAKFVEWGLNAAAIPYFRDGLVFELVNGRYEIAEACAGLRFLVATVALGVLFAHLIYARVTKIVLFISCCFVVPVIGNGIRALLTVMVANYTNNRVAAGFDHIVYGWVFAVTIIVGLLFVGSYFRDPDQAISAGVSPTRMPASRLKASTTIGGLALVLSCVFCISFYAAASPAPIDAAALNRLPRADNWRPAAGARDWSADFPTPTGFVLRSFSAFDANKAGVVDMSVSYYARSGRSSSMLAAGHHPWDKSVWHPTERRSTHFNIGSDTVPFDEYIIGSGEKRRLVWNTYWIDGHFATSSPVIRLLELKAGLSHGASAIIAVSTPINGPVADARNLLGQFLSDQQMLSDRLLRIGQQR